MFKSAPAAVPATEPVEAVRDERIPLSHLGLDVPVSQEGWPVYLGRRGISFGPDAIGRDSISHGDARRLLDEYRADQLRRQAALKVQEAAAVEADQLRLAGIWKGVSADEIPVGVHPALRCCRLRRIHSRNG